MPPLPVQHSPELRGQFLAVGGRITLPKAQNDR